MSNSSMYVVNGSEKVKLKKFTWSRNRATKKVKTKKIRKGIHLKSVFDFSIFAPKSANLQKKNGLHLKSYSFSFILKLYPAGAESTKKQFLVAARKILILSKLFTWVAFF